MAAAPAKGFRISMTAEWWDLPLDPVTREAEITALITERRADATPELQRQIVRILCGTAAVAHDIGAALCSEYAGTDEEGRLKTANLLVAAAPDDLSGAHLEELAAEMAQQGFPGPTDPPPTECFAVNLPQAGPAIRVRFDPRPPGSEPPAIGPGSLGVQFFVPVPGASMTTVVTFSAPVLAGHEPDDDLVPLFDAMAETFCFLDEQGEQLPPAA